MKFMKTFDCINDMPDKVRTAFFQYESICGEPGNDCWVDWYTGNNLPENEEADEKIVNNWLYSQGIQVDETVLIRHWW